MEFTKQSCEAFADALASKASVPGGGGAAALVGALGTALCTMVGNFTVGKKKYAAVEAEVQAIMEQAEALRAKLMAQVEADAAAFEPLSKAYGISKDDPSRGEVMERCLRSAAAVPMEILRLCCQAIELHQKMLDRGSVLMISDVGTGVLFCQSALYAAGLNVQINTKSMADRAYAAALDREAEQRMAAYGHMATAVYEEVKRRLS